MTLDDDQGTPLPVIPALSTAYDTAPMVGGLPTLTTDRELTIATTFEEAGDSRFGIAFGTNAPLAIPVRIPIPGKYRFTITLEYVEPEYSTTP